MNPASQRLEPRWAIYLKSAAWIFPPLFIWVGSCILVVPKLKEICQVSGTAFPTPVLTALALSDFCKNNLILGTVLILVALALLEWWSRGWLRYRRPVFGIVAFGLNLIALILVTTMMVFTVTAGANLLSAK
jgi:type II secretory pathway component PulF